jgi:hypothetical protein
MTVFVKLCDVTLTFIIAPQNTKKMGRYAKKKPLVEILGKEIRLFFYS